MIRFNQIFILLSAAILGVILFIYGGSNNQSNCIELVTPTALASVKNVNNIFANVSYENAIRILPRDSSDVKGFILAIDAHSYKIDPQEIIVTSDDPKYVEGEFNGRRAAVAHWSTTEGSEFFSYEIPIGEGGFSVLVSYTGLIPEDKKLAEDMVRSVLFSELDTNVSSVVVRECE